MTINIAIAPDRPSSATAAAGATRPAPCCATLNGSGYLRVLYQQLNTVATGFCSRRKDRIRLKCTRREAHDGAKRERHAEPRETAENVCSRCAARVRRDRALPVRLVEVDGRGAYRDSDSGVCSNLSLSSAGKKRNGAHIYIHPSSGR